MRGLRPYPIALAVGLITACTQAPASDAGVALPDATDCAPGCAACDATHPCCGGNPCLGGYCEPGFVCDAGAPVDAHVYVAPDGGPTGAALTPTDPCDDVEASLYDTPAGLPPFSADVRGTLLGCATLETISASELTTRLASVPGAVVRGAVRVYLVAYRTEREPRGVGGISTALVFLPDVALSDRVPLVLAAHGSIGLADHCAPSIVRHTTTTTFPASYLDAFWLPWAAAGLPVVAPDYAGLGTEGVHGYGNWPDPARSAIDGVRALRSLLPPDRLDGDTLVYGHSQGGGITLAVAAYAAEAPDVHLAALVALAPGYAFTRVAPLLSATGVTVTPITHLTVGYGLYADHANLTPDTARWGEAFHPALRDFMTSTLATECYGEALTAFSTPTATYTPPSTVGDTIDPAFASAVAACRDGTGTCDPLVGAWLARDTANDPHIPEAGAPPLLITASADDEAVGPGLIGCVAQAMRRDHVPFDLCTVEGFDHLGMVGATTGFALAWALAAARGDERPPCAASTVVPSCRLL